MRSMLSRAARLAAAAFALGLSLLAAPVGAAPLSVDEAIRSAWRDHPGLAAGEKQAAAARADAEGTRDARLPTLSFTARGVVTDEPMVAFGLKLDQQRIAQADFAPPRLNAPDPVGGVGLGATLVQPIWAGGRLAAGRRAASAQADAEASAQLRRRDELAVAVVEAYFGAQVAAQGLAFAEDQLQSARETERFTRERNRQDLALDADLARATAFRAQAEAALATARQRLASARSALVLLAGDGVAGAELTTPVGPEGIRPSTPLRHAQDERGLTVAGRPDVAAARDRATAAAEASAAARGALLPEVFAQAGVETMRSSLEQGATWFSAALVARWQLSLGEVRTSRAAEARAAAASEAARWQERQALREADEARRAVETAEVRVASAREAVAASESARTLRQARHRQGLLPLTDVLDAEAALAGARALFLESQLDARLARAQLQLASGQPIEGVRS